jgi:DNA polymerase I
MPEPAIPALPLDGDRLFLADAMALAYRAHFAFISRPLTDKHGNETSAAYGFTASLLKLLEDERPEHIAVVFDPTDGEPTFRDRLYEQYKSNRPPMPEGIQFSIPYIKRIVQALDIPCLEVSGMEADDVIGTLARRAEADGVNVVIFSADKDFRQLLSDRIAMLRPAYKGEAFDLETVETFKAKYGGLHPAQFVDMLALMGDASDNVPGVPGIGEKTAVKLLQDYGGIENLLANAGEVSGKRAREGLINHRQDALLSRELVEIRTDLELDVDWHRLRRTEPHLQQVEEIFDELDFGTRLRDRVRTYASGGRQPAPPEPVFTGEFDFGEQPSLSRMDLASVDYATAKNQDQLTQVAAEIGERGVLAFDTETTSRDGMMASLVGLALSWEPGTARYVPSPLPDGTSEQAVLDALRPCLAGEECLRVGHNVKYDLIVLARHGVDVVGPVFDTMVAHYLIAPEEPHNLDAVCQKVLNYCPKPITDLIGEGKDQKNMRDVSVDEVGPYACEDADVALRLMEPLRERLEKDGLLKVAEEIEFPLIPVLAEMEMKGVLVDTDVLERISDEMGDQIEALEKEIFAVAGTEFNIGSTQQLGEILFERLKLPVRGKTAKGAVSTRESVLLELATEHELPRLILDWRQASKLKNTYVDKLPELIHPETGRIHTDFNQTVTATGRLSSSNPNLQNIPVRSEAGREIRRAFVAGEGHVLLCADYAQIELRILASMAEDPDLIAAFEQGLDIHTATASRVFGVPLDAVTRMQRGYVKQVNYGIPYGVSAFGLAQRLRVTTGEAAELISQYRSSYPGVIRLLGDLVEQARHKGYAETLTGRRRYVPDIGARNPRIRSAAERIAVNMPIQGTQADMIKLAMVGIHRRIRQEHLASRMILQVHDELVFEVPEGEERAMETIVREEMVGALPLQVPIEVDVGFGKNWLEGH